VDMDLDVVVIILHKNDWKDIELQTIDWTLEGTDGFGFGGGLGCRVKRGVGDGYGQDRSLNDGSGFARGSSSIY
jgi:hypothetical protein